MSVHFRTLVPLLILLGSLTQALPGQEILYFEPARVISTDNARFPEVVNDADRALVFYQDIERTGADSGRIYISAMQSINGRDWFPRRRIVGPIEFQRESAPLIFSALMAPNGEIFLAVAAEATAVDLYRSRDGGVSFSRTASIRSDTTVVSPRLSLRSDGGMILFVSQNIGAVQSILFSYTREDQTWSDFATLESDPQIGLNFLPTHVAADGRDYVVFQGINPALRATYQLYSKYSDDGGRTWSQATRLSSFHNEGEAPSPDAYDNQRAMLARVPGGIALVWERRLSGTNTQIYYAGLNRDARLSGEPEAVTTRLTNDSYPRILVHRNEVILSWFDSPQGNSRVFIARREGAFWQERGVSQGIAVSRFARPFSFRGRMHMFWQGRRTAEVTNLVYLEPDQHVDPPRPAALSFPAGGRSRTSRMDVSWTPAPDASGIRGYNYIVSQNPNQAVPQVLRYTAGVRQASVTVDQDGDWFFRIIAQDNAGNWSEPATISYTRVTRPPEPPRFAELPVDENGFLLSNTFRIEWEPYEDPSVVAGYAVRLQRIGPVGLQAEPQTVSLQPPAASVNVRTPAVMRSNVDNGTWALQVATVDDVGNISEPQLLVFRTNKYIPVTEIWNVSTTRDRLGRYTLTVTGRGFTANGTISEVVLDRTGEAPYDYVFRSEQEAFTVLNNGRIEGPLIDLIQTGEYRVGLLHTDRGLRFTNTTVRLEEAGTVTFGDFSGRYIPRYMQRDTAQRLVPIETVLGSLVALLLAFVIAVSATRMAALAAESRLLDLEVKALITGTVLPAKEKKEILRAMKLNIWGLRFKFALFVVVLVVTVVVLVAYFLGTAALTRQEDILARGLEQRVEVLLDSLVTQSSQLLDAPQQNIIELAGLTRQSAIMEEVQYITITGRGVTADEFDYIWSTNDPIILSFGQAEETNEPERLIQPTLSTAVFQPAGASQVIDIVSEEIPQLEAAINERARAELGNIPDQIDQFTERISQLVLIGTPQAEAELEEIDRTRQELEARVSEVLAGIGSEFYSFPEFDPGSLSRADTEFVFYKPVLFRPIGEPANEARYYRGMVRMGVSTEIILQEISEATRELIIATVFVAAAALLVGIIGAILLATIVVIPIKRLVAGVELIRDTEDKAQLEHHSITLRSRDELATLANTVNSMTQGLVAAAKANKDLTLGKEVQKRFIPLEPAANGEKMTIGYTDLPQVEFFGYYEGAKGVSGDYYDYQQLDEYHYAIIKCDIAGKGVAASLIMVEVATIFLDHFKNWTLKSPGLKLEPLVLRINDLIAERGFQGRFAAFTVGILNIVTGKVVLANAGDNQLHLYRAGQGHAEQLSMDKTPAAGVFSSEDMPIRFPEYTLQLQKDDIMVFFTDGIEEAKRVFRDENEQPYFITDADVENKRVRDDILAGQGDEEFGIPRIHEVLNSLGHKRAYVLHEELSDQELGFRLQDCDYSARSFTMALVAIEKVFRSYKPRVAKNDDVIRVDKVVDDFLAEHFEQYEQFFGTKQQQEDGGYRATPLREDLVYRYFSGLREDEQYDDLTVLMIRKK